MPWRLPENLDIPENRNVAAFLRRESPSAHDDVSTELSRAIEGLPGVRTFCPDVRAYAYVVAHDAAGRVFALACGQSRLAARVGKANLSQAAADSGEPAAEIGEDWVWFRAFRADESRQVTCSRLGRWCRRAHQNSCSE
jgi:hypothetical protein